MKRLTAALFAILVLLGASGCSRDIGIIDGSDGPTEIIVAGSGTEAGRQSLPDRIEHEYTYNEDEMYTHNMTLKAYSKDGGLLWEYVTPDSITGQCESLEYLGTKNGLVYISENCLYDAETMNGDMSLVFGRLRALSASDGSVIWDNREYSGTGSSCVFDDEGCIYITGYFGPDCTKIDCLGRTLWTVSSADPSLYWAYDITLEDDVLTICYEMNGSGEPDTARISTDGELLG